MFVVTADQKRSTRRGDHVPAALTALGAMRAGLTDAGPGVLLPFERTVGDEIQGVLQSPAATVSVLTVLVRLGHWRVGVGIGAVDTPLPASTREASGPAFVAAREAVTAAHSSPADLRVLHAVGASDYGRAEMTRRAESALWLLTAVLRRRTPEGWEIAEMTDEGLTGRAVAQRLGISASAVSQRLARAAVHEARRGAELAEALLAEADA